MREPLTPLALIAAVTDGNNSTLQLTHFLGICANMVMLDTNCNVLRFAHQSFQEYLHRHQSFTAASAHSLLASACINTCARGSGSADSLLLPQSSDDLYAYAVMYWPLHYKMSNGSETYESLFRSVMGFIFDEDFDTTLSFDTWLRSVRKLVILLPNDHAMKPALDSIPISDTGFIFLISVFGLDTILNAVFSNLPDLDVNQRNHLGHAPVYLAAALGHLDTLSMLLDRGSDVDIECGKYGSPLYAACFSGHVAVVDKLLQFGASTSCGAVFGNALQAAFNGSRENVALHLLEKGAIKDTEDAYEHAMQGAAQAGLISVVERLQLPPFLRQGQDKPDKTRKRTKRAIEYGQVDVLRGFLEPFTDVTNLLPPDAVALATLRNHRDIVEFLLDKGMNMEFEGCMGTPLRTACLLNCSAIARLLLDRKANINACSGTMGAALQASAMQGHTTVTKLLIDGSADINQQSGFYGTALQAAAYRGHKRTVELLLDAGADVHAEGFSRDAFHAAAEGGHQDILNLMLNRGYMIRHTPPGPMCSISIRPKYRALLRDASPGANVHSRLKGRRSKDRKDLPKNLERPSHEFYTIFELVRSYEVEREATQAAAPGYTPRKNTLRENWPLEASASAGHPETVSLLLEKRDVLHIEGDELTAAVKVAAEKGHCPVLRLLLDYVAKRQPIDRYIVTVYDTARKFEQPQTVDFALAMASKHCSAKCVAKMREKPVTRVDKYQTSVEVGRDELILDFKAACASGSTRLLDAILYTGSQRLLGPCELDLGLQICTVHGQATMARFMFESAPLKERLPFSEESYVAAAGHGHLDIIKLFTLHWRHNLSVASSRVIRRALSVSSEHGHTEVIRYLVEELSADVNMLAPDKPFAGDRFWLTRLIKSGSSSTSSGYSYLDEISPLQAALRGFQRSILSTESLYGNRHEEVLMLLLKCGARPDNLGGRSMYPIQLAAKSCSLSVINALISSGADVNAKNAGDTALYTAAGREMSAASIVSSLLEAGATIPKDTDEASHLLGQALGFFQENIASQHIHNRIFIDGRFSSAPSLQYVFEEGPAAVLYMLLSEMPQIRIKEYVGFGLVLQMTAFLDNHSYVDLLLSRSVDINATGYYYGTALQAAARCGHERMVQKLLDAGAQVNTLQGRWGTALRAAIVGSHNSVVQTLLRHGADITLKFDNPTPNVDYEGEIDTALQLAVRSASLDIVQALLVNGADAVRDPPETLHPLIMGAQVGNRDMLRVLIKFGAPVNVPGKAKPRHAYIAAEDTSPLHAAVAGGHLSAIEELLSSGANIDHDFAHVGTPLSVAASKGKLLVVQILLSAGASKAKDKALYEAVCRGHTDIVRTLLNSGVTPDGGMLAAACKNSGQLEIVELLLEKLYAGGHPDVAVEQAFRLDGLDDNVFLLLLEYAPITQERLFQACRAGSLSAVKLILDWQTVDVNGRDNESASTPLQIAASHLHAEVVRILLEFGAEVSSESWVGGHGTSLMAVLEACAASSLRRISTKRAAEPVSELLLPAPHLERDHRPYLIEDVNPSYFQKLSSCEKIVQLLISHGADVNDDRRPYGPPLHLACLLGSNNIVQLLLDNGADVDATAGYFEKAVFAALEGGHPDILLALLERVPSTKYVHPDYATPLHLACDKGDGVSVRRLLDFGADITVTNSRGETPLTLALKERKRRVLGSREPHEESPLDVIMEVSRPLGILDEDFVAASHTNTLAKLLDIDRDIQISEQAICRILHETYMVRDTIELVMKRSGGIGVTAGMLQAVRSDGVLEKLLQHRPVCDITNELLESQASLRRMQLLLSLQEHDTQVSERVILHALELGDSDYSRKNNIGLRNGESEKAVLEILLERNPHTVVTQEMLKGVRCSEDMEILLKRLEPGTKISDDIVENVAKSKVGDVYRMIRQLQQFDPSVTG